jgi:hypothetical protein
MAATRDGHTQIRKAPGRSGVRVLFHTAFAPEVLWATERVVRWRGQHSPIVKVVCDFNDPETGAAEVRATVLADSWSDSGINAFSVVATLDHQYTKVTTSDPCGRTSDVHSLGRRTLSDRYATMFASYATEDACCSRQRSRTPCTVSFTP